MITNCDATVVRVAETPVIISIPNVEWQHECKRLSESSGAKKQYSTSVFCYGKSDHGIKLGDYIVKGGQPFAGKTGKELLRALQDAKAQIIYAIEDNRSESIPFMEIKCNI